MKSSVLLFFLLLFFSQITLSQTESRFYPNGRATDSIKKIKKDFKSKKLLKMPSFNVQAMMKEDTESQKSVEPRPFRFGKAFHTDIYVSIEDDGDETEEGRTWAMEFHSKGALSINFVLE